MRRRELLPLLAGPSQPCRPCEPPPALILGQPETKTVFAAQGPTCGRAHWAAVIASAAFI